MTLTYDFPLPKTRLRRLRQHPQLRNLLRETRLSPQDFIHPLFIHATLKENKAIPSMQGHSQLSLRMLPAEIKEICALNIPAVLLFGIPEHKDSEGSDAWRSDGVIQKAIQIIKECAPQLLVISDLCFCEYTDHGHCGFIGHTDVDNDKTLELLIKQALSHAEAGADVIAPSGMMDGVIAALRFVLDQEGYSHIPLLSYAVKYSSGLYGPFRDAAEGSPKFGNRSTYQMDPANASEALREAELDIAEGADILMVKPAGAYLDIIVRLHERFPQIPLWAYHVSGEFAMIKAAAEKGWIDGDRVAIEILTAIKRAGAQSIIHYFSKDIVPLLG